MIPQVSKERLESLNDYLEAKETGNERYLDQMKRAIELQPELHNRFQEDLNRILDTVDISGSDKFIVFHKTLMLFLLLVKSIHDEDEILQMNEQFR